MLLNNHGILPVCAFYSFCSFCAASVRPLVSVIMRKWKHGCGKANELYMFFCFFTSSAFNGLSTSSFRKSGRARGEFPLNSAGEDGMRKSRSKLILSGLFFFFSVPDKKTIKFFFLVCFFSPKGRSIIFWKSSQRGQSEMDWTCAEEG